jgi:hypothetical protein
MAVTFKDIARVVADDPNPTVADIGRAVGLKKTPYLSSLIRRAVKRHLIVQWVDDSEFPPRFRYYVQETEEMEL